ncbi:MAG: hypothetical protein R2753_15620 [Chitinophagales bacterium]
MEKLIEIKNEYNSLNKLNEFLQSKTAYECSKEYDIWEQRTNSSGQMEQCIVIKKSGMHAVKVFFTSDNTAKISYVIPNKMMNAYFGKSVKARRSIIEVIIGKIMQALLAAPQKKAFEELEQVVKQAA